MKIVQGDEIPLVRGLEHRGGIFHRLMMEGEAGTIDNFQLSIGVSRAISTRRATGTTSSRSASSSKARSTSTATAR